MFGEVAMLICLSSSSRAMLHDLLSSRPKARPPAFGITESASIASLTCPLMPRPSQPAERTSSTCGQELTKAKRPVVRPVKKFPETAIGFRLPARSLNQPAPSLTKEETASDIPSIMPSAKAGAPMEIRNSGRTAVAISWPASQKKLDNSMPKMLRLSQHPSSGASFFIKSFTLPHQLSGYHN